MAVFEQYPCDMIRAPKNTFRYTVFSTDFGVYLCISLMLSPCLSNLKKPSIFLELVLISSNCLVFLVIRVLNCRRIFFQL